MTDFVSAFKVSTAINLAGLSHTSGCSTVIHPYSCVEPKHRSIDSYSLDATGSSLSSSTILGWIKQSTRTGQKVIVRHSEPKRILEEVSSSQNSLVQKLDFISSVFFLNEEELASSLDVSRKTVFNWKNQKSNVSKAKAQLIFDLYLLAKNWSDADFSRNAFDLVSPILAGQSVKDMLKESKLDSEKILFAGSRLAHQSLSDETTLF
ncbi:hypothetical protein [Acinetobacter soli]|uniref:hypothetical protein n=1 Tax=Acinetobacter soli TaxID=487316 RepID=UPI00124FF8EA|nr:hypothetical protein [Acinetobacter soli]